MDELQSRTAVVTGAASGMGLAFAEGFLAEGMSVVLADVEAPALEEATDRLGRRFGSERVLAVHTDVADSTSVIALRDAHASLQRPPQAGAAIGIRRKG